MINRYICASNIKTITLVGAFDGVAQIHHFMSIKSPLGLVLYCYLNMPTINKTYLILSYHQKASSSVIVFNYK